MIIDRYLRREISVPFVSVSAVLVSIFVTFSLTRFLMDANAGLLLPSEIFQLTVAQVTDIPGGPASIEPVCRHPDRPGAAPQRFRDIRHARQRHQ
jgi:hypothetical protein